MISLEREREMHLLQQRVCQNPDALGYYMALPGEPSYVFQFYNTGKELFGAIYAQPATDMRRDFRKYLAKIDRN